MTIRMAANETIDSRNILVRSFRPEQLVPEAFPTTVDGSFQTQDLSKLGSTDYTRAALGRASEKGVRTG